MASNQAASPPDFEELLGFIKNERGFDFTGYKRPSLLRRVNKRMQTVGIDDYARYRKYLEQNSDEFVHLFNTILINVTSFFRDRATWDLVSEEVVPRIVGAKDDGRPIRIWSTGCATGEEAYTAAMIVANEIGDEAFRKRVKIYATDVDEDALSIGRHATYAAGSLDDVPADFRERFFQRVDSRFAFKKELKRNVIFGRHDLIQDPPISRVDLLIARNTLMYFDAATQHRILGGFRFSLTEEGVLFLGKSEVLVTRTGLFTPLDLKRRLFVKAQRTELPYVAPGAAAQRRGPTEAPASWGQQSGFEHSPVPQLVVDAKGTVVAVNRSARSAFGISRGDLGRPVQDLEISYKPLELRSRIEQVYTEGHAVSAHDVESAGANGEPRFHDVLISPLVQESDEIFGVAVSFLDSSRVKQLEAEVVMSKREMESAAEELQSTVEELETTNEELQSTNEELETTNEELQSMNEELETMNEELQSTNEELETMNSELQDRTDEVSEGVSFLESILVSLEAAVVVLDLELAVLVWNRRAEDMWGLRADEALGQHFLNLDIGLPVDQLRKPVRDVIAEEVAAPLIVDAVNRRGRSFRCRVLASPLSTAAGGMRGVILLMEDEDVQAGRP